MLDIYDIRGVPIDHSFLKYKKELLEYGYQVGKISMKAETVVLEKLKVYEATSIAQIADAVGLRKASLYSHFENKQDILDTLGDEMTKEFNQHSIFVKADWDNPEFTKSKKGRSVEEIIAEVKGQIHFLISEGILKDEDPEIMATQFVWPISMWTNLCDREPERESEAKELLDRHIRQFFRVYGK